VRALPILLVAALGCHRSGSTAEQQPPPKPAAVTTPTAVAEEPKVDTAKAIAALTGTTPPEWQLERWIGSAPKTLASTRGSVLMVRWWTAGCPFCSTSAPALRHFDEVYGKRGLQVMGVYHHKEDTPFDPKVYEDTAKKYGFKFPLAFDPDWKTLESWLRDRDGKAVSTGWTSVTFLLDKKGVIRHVHPGGQYVEGDPAYAEMQAAIERLLAES
jgi:peroxiredoxin